MKKIFYSLLVAMGFLLGIQTICIAQHTAIGFHGRMGVPIGDFADEAKIGFGGGMDAYFFTKQNLVFNMGFNYSIYTLKTAQIPTITSADFRAVQLKLGLHYLFGKQDVRPYIGLQGGLSLFSSKIKNSYTDQTVDMGNAFNLCPTAGLFIVASPKVGIDLNVGYMINFSKTSPSPVNYSYNITYIPINLGFHYLFGYNPPKK